MNKSIIVCNNEECRNHYKNGCDRSWVDLDERGRCRSAGKPESKQNWKEAVMRTFLGGRG